MRWSCCFDMLFTMRRALMVMLATAGLVLAGCSGGSETSTGTTEGSVAAGTTAATPPGTSGSVPGSTAVTEPGQPVPVVVYLVRDERVAPVAAEAGSATSVASDAVEALLAGPSPQEQAWGFTTAIPTGTELLGLDIAEGVATVDLTSAFTGGGGSLSMEARVAQVVFTLTQFEAVETVTFHIDGAPVDAIGGEGIVVDPPVDRDDFANVRPVIEVTSPLPGATVASPLTLEGESATFEATVSVVIVDASGAEVYSGFLTSTGSNGVWGPFTDTVEFDVTTPGPGTVVLYEADMSGEDPDGRNFVVEIPVTLG